jgi:hypothetical protein
MTKPMAVRSSGEIQPRSMLSFTKKMTPRNNASPPTQAKSFAPMNCSRLMLEAGRALGAMGGGDAGAATGSSGALAKTGVDCGIGGGVAVGAGSLAVTICGSSHGSGAGLEAAGLMISTLSGGASGEYREGADGAVSSPDGFTASRSSMRFRSRFSRSVARAWTSRRDPSSLASSSARRRALLARTTAMIGRMSTAPPTIRRMRIISSIMPRSVSGSASNGN